MSTRDCGGSEQSAPFELRLYKSAGMLIRMYEKFTPMLGSGRLGYDGNVRCGRLGYEVMRALIPARAKMAPHASPERPQDGFNGHFLTGFAPRRGPRPNQFPTQLHAQPFL